MNINLTRLTDNVYELRLSDESLSSDILMTEDEIVMLAEVISKYSELSVSESTGKWYNS